MATVNIVGAGHPGDPFQVQILLEEETWSRCGQYAGSFSTRGRGGYDADPPIRSVIVQIADPDAG